MAFIMNLVCPLAFNIKLVYPFGFQRKAGPHFGLQYKVDPAEYIGLQHEANPPSTPQIIYQYI